MKILVIGASGLLAGPVIRKLDEKGYDLRLFSRSVKPSMFVNDHEITQGDVFNVADLEKAVSGCDALHISLASADDVKAVSNIIEVSKRNGVRRISLVSGCTVAEENRWFKFTDDKFRTEQMIMQSGFSWYIFRPTWFFDSLPMFVRNGKASVLGRLTDRYHWVAADDLGTMVADAYSTAGAENRIYYVYGPERYTMKEMLEKYCRALHPEIKSVGETPLLPLKIIAFLTRNRQLKFAASLFGYFEKVHEPEISEDDLALLARPETDFDTWVKSKQ
ncbi:MAG TPA: NAD(P)H-binding protein [Bacteroidales bacterium]|nr:NAD(P)H-binding protein [Bacteroidales bacterium]HNT93853.1 NAD(P)H-binding protein [Bacteroidales bacterium]